MGTRRKRTPQRQSEAGFLCDRTTEVREMRTAETILNIIQDRGKRKLPLDDVYRQLYNPAMYLRAYARLYKNDGAMTPGMTEETVDGWSMEKVAALIVAIRDERWQWTPVITTGQKVGQNHRFENGPRRHLGALMPWCRWKNDKKCCWGAVMAMARPPVLQLSAGAGVR